MSGNSKKKKHVGSVPMSQDQTQRPLCVSYKQGIGCFRVQGRRYHGTNQRATKKHEMAPYGHGERNVSVNSLCAHPGSRQRIRHYMFTRYRHDDCGGNNN